MSIDMVQRKTLPPGGLAVQAILDHGDPERQTDGLIDLLRGNHLPLYPGHEADPSQRIWRATEETRAPDAARTTVAVLLATLLNRAPESDPTLKDDDRFLVAVYRLARRLERPDILHTALVHAIRREEAVFRSSPKARGTTYFGRPVRAFLYQAAIANQDDDSLKCTWLHCLGENRERFREGDWDKGLKRGRQMLQFWDNSWYDAAIGIRFASVVEGGERGPCRYAIRRSLPFLAIHIEKEARTDAMRRQAFKSVVDSYCLQWPGKLTMQHISAMLALEEGIRSWQAPFLPDSIKSPHPMTQKARLDFVHACAPSFGIGLGATLDASAEGELHDLLASSNQKESQERLDALLTEMTEKAGVIVRLAA